MKCEELVTYLSDYIDRGLEEDLLAEAQEHLSTCHNCRVVLDTTQQTILLYRKWGKKAIPASRRADLFRRLQEALPEDKNNAETM
jgi:predicted anti-sigma-YlaC factor YlaD